MVVYLFTIWLFLFIQGNLIPVGTNDPLTILNIAEVSVLPGITNLVEGLTHAK